MKAEDLLISKQRFIQFSQPVKAHIEETIFLALGKGYSRQELVAALWLCNPTIIVNSYFSVTICELEAYFAQIQLIRSIDTFKALSKEYFLFYHSSN